MEIKYAARQQEFLDAVLAGKSVFLTGEAGSGKTFIVKKAIQSLIDANKNVLISAPTGIAANNLDGQTVHSLFGLTPFGVLTYDKCNFLRKEKRRVLDKAHVIVIDEISMVRSDMLDAIHWTLKKNNLRGLDKYQVILIGDLEQLPPVADDNFKSVLSETHKSVFFYDSLIYPKMKVEKIELDQVQRQSDPEFISALNQVRRGEKSPYFRRFFHSEPKGIVLAPRLETVNRYNEHEYAKLSGKEYVFQAETNIIKEGAKISFADFNVEPLIKMKDGAKIMYLRNSLAYNNLKNGTLGIFRAIEDEDGDVQFFIEVNTIKYRLEINKFDKKEYVYNEKLDRLELVEIANITQMPIKLAYAMTIHKSQGQTLSQMTLDLTLPCFEKGMLYVALSRVTSPEGLRIIMEQ